MESRTCCSKDNPNTFFTKPMSTTKVVIKQGDKGTDFFIVLEGKAVVTQQNDKGESGKVGELGAAQYFGKFICILFYFCQFWLSVLVWLVGLFVIIPKKFIKDKVFLALLSSLFLYSIALPSHPTFFFPHPLPHLTFPPPFSLLR